MGSDFPDRIPVEVDIDPRRRMLAFQAEIERLERERVNLEVNLKGIKGVAARIKLLARDRRMKIRADIDRNQFGRTGYFIGKVFKGGAAIAAGALGGVFRSLSLVSSGLGNVGNVGQKVFGRMADGSSKLAGSAGKAANMISNIVGALLAMTLGISVIFAIVTALGALVVAAIGAVAVLASVLVGALALLAIPSIFAGIAIASVSLANRNDDLRKSFVKLKDTVTKTVQQTAKPMLDFFTDSIEKLNKALKKGSPLYNQISTSFSESTKALKPLRSGLMEFGTNTLSGVNSALKNLNQGNTMSVFATSLGNMGSTIGNFAGTLSTYAPDIATSFTHLTSGLDKIGVSVANWIGKFSGGRASQVIDSFSEATTKLFDAYANNAGVYMAAAENLGDALGQAVPGVEKLTASFAKMSPGIFESLASGINKLGNAVSDPGLQSGLSNLTSMMIDLTANILTGATKAAGTIGNFLKTQGDLFDMWTGHLYDNKRVTTKMFEDLIKSEGSVRDKVNKGLQQLNRSVLRSTHDDGEKLVQYANSALVNLGKVEGGVSKHVTDLGGKLQKLAEEWKNAGGKVGQNWYDAWKQASQEVDKSGNETLMKTRDQMNGLVNESLAFRNRLKASLIQAFQSQNIPITDGLISQIDQALGLVSSSAETKSKEAVANIQRNFALLPGIIQTAMNEAKTPEQLQKKLMDVQKVMDTMTPQIAQAFAKLPTSMQETLAKSATAFTEWTALETFKSKVTTTVDAVVQQFDRLPSAIGGSSGVIAGLVGQFGGAAASIQGFNAQANWANWILNQIGAQAAWAGWQMGQIGVNAGSAAGAVTRLNTGANGLQGAFTRAGTSAATANAKLQSLGTGASTASGRFSVFSAVVSGVMARAQGAVAAGVAGMISDLLVLPGAAARAGNLSAFVGSIQSSMSRAQGIVTSAVANMLAQLNRLNTTVTARVRVETDKVPSTNDITPNITPNFAPFSTFSTFDAPEFTALTFDAPMATTFDAQASAAGEALAPWGRSILKTLREERSDVNSGGVTKNYYYTINAAPNVPTEKQLVKAQRFNDNLYGE